MMPIDNIDILRLTADTLESRFGAGTADRVDISVAGDLAQVIEQLASAPHARRIIISDEGDAPANDDQPETGVYRQTIALYVAMAAGLPAKVKSRAWFGAGGKPALLSFCNDVRDLVRAIVFPEHLTSERFEYTGRQVVLGGDGSPLHAYRLSFQIYGALPEVEPQPIPA